MAGEWIKMRTSLLKNPKVNGIAKILESDKSVAKVLSTGFGGRMEEIVTRDVMRYVTVASLLVTWGNANELTRDGVFTNCDLSDIDDMTGIPGFGAALESVGWAEYDGESNSVTLPNFNEYNTSGAERSANSKSGAQRQKEYRERKALQKSDVTSDVTRNRREEKRREDISITNVIEANTKKVKFDPESLKELMPQDLGVWWVKWIEYRRLRKLSTKEPTWKAQAENLNEWGKAGHNPCEIIKASIDNGWQGLFEPKQNFNGGHYAANQQFNGARSGKEKASPSDRVRAQARTLIQRLDDKNDGSNLYADGGFIPAEGNQ